MIVTKWSKKLCMFFREIIRNFFMCLRVLSNNKLMVGMNIDWMIACRTQSRILVDLKADYILHWSWYTVIWRLYHFFNQYEFTFDRWEVIRMLTNRFTHHCECRWTTSRNDISRYRPSQWNMMSYWVILVGLNQRSIG